MHALNLVGWQAEDLEESAERMRERAADQGFPEEAQALLQQAQESLYQDQEALRALQAESALRSAEQAHHSKLVAELHAHVASVKVMMTCKAAMWIRGGCFH